MTPPLSAGRDIVVVMIRAYVFRLRPTVGQARRLEQMLDVHRELYNAALEERREAYLRGVSLSYIDQAKELSDGLREAVPELAPYSIDSLRCTLHRLDRAFKAFYRRVRAGERPGYPRFRSRARFDSVEVPIGGGAAWDPGTSRVRIMGVGTIRVHAHRETKGRPKLVTVKREGHRWHVVIVCDEVPAEPLPVTNHAVGIDLGVSSFLATSDGELVSHPRHLAASAERLAKAQRRVSTKKRGSARRCKAVRAVAEVHRKVRNQRRDHHHKTALALVRAADVIVVEDLRVANMTRRPAPRPVEQNDGRGSPGGDSSREAVSAAESLPRPADEVSDRGYAPNGASAKSGLNRAILDGGWSSFLMILAGKAEGAGRELVRVDPRYTSQTCAACGHVDPANREGSRFACTLCGHVDHADLNAARNILGAGLALQIAIREAA